MSLSSHKTRTLNKIQNGHREENEFFNEASLLVASLKRSIIQLRHLFQFPSTACTCTAHDSDSVNRISASERVAASGWVARKSCFMRKHLYFLRTFFLRKNRSHFSPAKAAIERSNLRAHVQFSLLFAALPRDVLMPSGQHNTVLLGSASLMNDRLTPTGEVTTFI